jgi:hypothetical protein
MKHGIEHVSTPRSRKGSMDVMTHLKGQVIAAMTDLEFWCLMLLGTILVISSCI